MDIFVFKTVKNNGVTLSSFMGCGEMFAEPGDKVFHCLWVDLPKTARRLYNRKVFKKGGGYSKWALEK